MTAQAKLGGYPGLRRTPKPTGTVGFQAGPRSFPANDPARGILPFEERAIRDALSNQAERATARRLVARGLTRAIPLVGEALLIYDAFDLLMPGGGEVVTTLPRDWQNASDRALTFPSNWTVNVTAWPTDDLAPFDAHHRADARRWWCDDPFDFTIGTVANESAPGEYEAAVQPFVTNVTPADIVNTNWASGTKISARADVDVSAVHPSWTLKHQDAQDYWARKNSAGANPTFTNPPRTVTEPGTGASIVPMDFPLPFPLFLTRAPNPALSPQEQTQFGPGGVTDPLPWEPPVQPGTPMVPQTPPDIVIGSPSPGSSPATGVDPGSSPAPAPVPELGTVPAPPPPGTQEHKVKISRGGVIQKIVAVAGATTEFLDAIDALWRALPKGLRTGYKLVRRKDGRQVFVKAYKPNVKQKIADVWNNWDKINIDQAVDNLLMNELQDQVIGRSHSALQRTYARNRLLQNRPGLMAGPWDTAGFDLLSQAS